MIYFEHEIFTFGTRSKKDVAEMRATIKEWGDVGYEVVSVVPASIDGSTVCVFLKRKVVIEDQDEGKAA